MEARMSVYVDGPNIDAVLGELLGHCPHSYERPRWDRVKAALPSANQPHFVLNKKTFYDKVFPLWRALRSMGWHVDVVAEVGPQNDDPVDFFICQQLTAICEAQRRGESQRVAVVAHDHGYANPLGEILRADGVVYVVGFREELAPDLLALEAVGAQILDLEHDIGAFACRLPRPSLPLYSVESHRGKTT